MIVRVAAALSFLITSNAWAQSWQQYATPAEAGFSVAALDSVRQVADSLRSGAVMIVYRGHVVGAYGDIARKFQAHSVRKSLLSALYGSAIADQKIDLNTTLSQLGIDDDSTLTAEEKQATLRDLISARSGIYLPAAYAGSDQDNRPERGSHAHGTHWFYNNWDFNVAGVAYEQLVGERWYESFQRRIADPVGMEDYTPADGYVVYEPTLTRHPAHTLRISTRDLARFGQLYLQRGKWHGKQVIPAHWVEESTGMHSTFADGSGYGYLWWIQPAHTLDAERYQTLRPHDVYNARGTGGQALFVIPGLELVVVHRGDTDHGRGVGGRAIWELLERIARARQGEAKPSPRLVAVAPIPLNSQLPAPSVVYADIPNKKLGEIIGSYQDGPVVSRIFMWQDRPYISVPGQGSAELFALPDGALTVRVQPGIRIEFDRAANGKITRMRTRIGSREFTAARVE